MIRTITLASALLLAAGAVHSQSLDGRLKKIAAAKTITIAYRTDATPFSFTDETKQVGGFSIDLCKRVVNSIERQLNVPNLKVHWLPLPPRPASMPSPRARPTWSAARAP